MGAYEEDKSCKANKGNINTNNNNIDLYFCPL